MNEVNLNSESEQNSELNKNKKRILKAISLIDDFVTKFVSKIEYYKMNLQSKLNNSESILVNKSLTIDQKIKENNSNN